MNNERRVAQTVSLKDKKALIAGTESIGIKESQKRSVDKILLVKVI